MATCDNQSDTYSSDMKRLTAKLEAAFQESKRRLAEAENNRDALRSASNTCADELNAEIANVRQMRRENRDRASRSAQLTRDIASRENDNEYLMEEFRTLSQCKGIEQERIARNDATRARMLGASVPTRKSRDYTSDEIKKYDAKMTGLSNSLRENDEKILQIRGEIDDLKKIDFNKERTALNNQLRLLKDRISHVRDDYDRAVSLVADAMTQRDRYDKCLIMAEMLSDYEKYLSTNCHETPCALWQTIQDDKGDFHDNWVKSGDTVYIDPEMKHFEEYLYTLVGTCNRHRYEYLKDTYVAECLCSEKGWLSADTMYCDPDSEGFRPNDCRCSHDNKMYWVEDENWTNSKDWWKHGPGWSDGVMFSEHFRELDFTIHSDVPPGYVTASM
jgi:hypothetical protein